MQSKFENGKITLKTDDSNNSRMDLVPPLTKLNLKGNKLKGNIILGNFSVRKKIDLSSCKGLESNFINKGFEPILKCNL